MPQTRPEVNPKSFVPKKKLGAKTVGFVGASLARGKYGFGTGRSREKFRGDDRENAPRGNKKIIANYFNGLRNNIRRHPSCRNLHS